MAFKAGMNSQNAECRRKIACYGFWFEVVTALPWLFVAGCFILSLMTSWVDPDEYDISALLYLGLGLLPVYFLWQAHTAPKGVKGEDRIWNLSAGGISKAFFGSPWLTTIVLHNRMEHFKDNYLLIGWTIFAFVITFLYLRASKIKNVIVAGLIREVLQGFPSVIDNIRTIYVVWTVDLITPIGKDWSKEEDVDITTAMSVLYTVASLVSIAVTCATFVILYRAKNTPKGKRKTLMAWAGGLQLVFIIKYLCDMSYNEYHDRARWEVRQISTRKDLGIGGGLWYFLKSNKGWVEKCSVFRTWNDANWIFGASVFAFFWLSVSMGCCTDKFSLFCDAGKTDSNDNGRVSVKIADKKSKKSKKSKNTKKAFK